MPANGTVFPAFIRAEYDPAGGGFARFEQDARATADRARRSFEDSFANVQKIARDALTMPRNAFGSLDLNVGQHRQAAAAAQAQAQALREVSTAAERAALSNRDNSEDTRLYLQAARAATIEAEENARALTQQADALDRLQREVNQSRSGTQAIVRGNQEMTESSRASRFAMVMVGQQAQDMAIQLQAGVPAQQIFVQQVSQMGFALSQMQGKLGMVGRFLTGGWGTALFLGVAASGYLISALRQTRDETEKALDATDGFSRAQSALAQIFDLTTGKLREQTGALGEHVAMLRLQVELTALQIELEASRQRNRATELFREGTRGMSFGETVGIPLATPRGQNFVRRMEQAEAAQQEQRSLIGAIRTAQQNLDQSRTEAQRAIARAALEQARMAALEASRRGGFGAYGLSAEEFQEAVISDALAEANAEIARRTRESLQSGRLDSGFHQRGRTRDRSREIESLREFGRDAADRIANLTGDFSDAPAVFERAATALRQVDHVMGDLVTKNARLRELTGEGFANFDELGESANQARDAIRAGAIREMTADFREQPRLIQRVALAMRGLEEAAREWGATNREHMEAARDGAEQLIEALGRPYRELLESQQEQYRIQDLVLRGREAEAETLRQVLTLQRQGAVVDEGRYQAMLAVNLALEEQARSLEILRGRQSLYLRAADEVRGSIADLLSNPEAGLRGINDFFGSLSSTFSRLRGELLTEKLFGGVFRQIEDYTTGRGQLRTANEQAAQGLEILRDATADAAAEEREQVSAANDLTAAFRRLEAQLEAMRGRMGASPLNIEPSPEIVSGSQLYDDRGSSALAGWHVGSVPGDPRDGGRRVHQGYDVFPGSDPRWMANQVVEVRNVRGHPTRSRQGITADIVFPDGSVWTAMHLAERPQTGTRRPGELIAVAGNTGNARTTPRHFHMEGRDAQGNRLDPRDYFSIGREATTAIESTTDRLAFLTGTLGDFEAAAAGAAVAVETAGAANDSGDEGPGLVVTANVPGGRLNPDQFVRQLITGLATPIFGRKVGEAIGDYLPQALEGASYGRMASNMILGQGGSSLGSQIGGAIGNIAGKKIGAAIGGTLGQFGGPIGSALGGILGGFAGNAFRSTPRASSTIGVGADGRMTVASTTGSSQYRAGTVEAADSAISTIERIAEALGGSVLSGVGSVSIGIRDGKYRVDPSGRGVTKTKKGAIDFGEDAEAAVRAATLDLIRDGILGGIRASTQRLLQGAKDLDAGIEKAVKFESVFQRLKEHLDPMGAALDLLDKEFASLKRIFDEAGASAEEYAELEKLYGMQRKRVLEETTEGMTSALRELLDDLTVNNDALSLRDRLAMAKAKYDPLAADLAAGKTVDYDAFAEAARTFLEINRQLNGSQEGYFTALDEVTALTKKALADQENIISIGTGRATPFDRPSGAVNDNAPVVGAIGQLGDLLVRELGGRLDALNTNTARALTSSSGGSVKPFAAFDDMRNF